MKGKTFYITTTLPYVNADPHMGHALEFVQTDIIARHKKSLGFDVFFNTGTDEHGQKIYQKALSEGKDPQEYVDYYANRFKTVLEKLGISPDVNFIRTTDSHHIEAAQEFWKKCDANGDIYKKEYKIKYCVGCELEKTDSELVDDKCPIHPNLEIQVIEEENYFFRFSKYQKKLLALYKESDNFVVPDFRLNEIRAFTERGLEDFSISRLRSKMPWGIPVPGDDEQVMYVWFDALVNYVSAAGWPNNTEKFNKWWPVVQFAGKDNLRQQSAIWQSMLMSAGIEPSKQIVIHGFITSGGQKMSKSLGNVINPFDVIEEFGTEALRYYVARHVHPFEDSDLTMDRFKEVYNADLANGLGNLVSRVIKMSSSYGVSIDMGGLESFEGKVENDFNEALNNYEFNKALEIVWKIIQNADKRIQDEQPFKLIKTDEQKAKQILSEILNDIYRIAKMLEIIIPETAKKILEILKENKMPETPLFPRKD